MSKKKTAIKGKKVMLWAAGKTVALSTSLSVDITADTSDTSNKDEGVWGAKEIGKMGWSVENGAMYSPSATGDIQQTYDSLFDLMVAGEAVSVTIGTPSNYNTGGLDALSDGAWTAPTAGMYSGSAIITSLKLQADDGSNGSVTISLEGVGALTKTAAA